MKLLIVIPFCKTDGAQAEQLCDWIFQLNESVPIGHVLLVAAADVHPELMTKVQLAAEVAFNTVTIFRDGGNTAPTKNEKINRMILNASEFVAKHFNWPFVLLEPDSVPLKPEWIEAIATAYESQPKRFLGSFMQFQAADKSNKLCLARSGVYPVNAADTLRAFCGTAAPFNMLAGETIIPMANKSGLFQQLEIKDVADLAKVRPDAVVVHGDKRSILLTSLQPAEKSPESTEAPKPPPARPLRGAAKKSAAAAAPVAA